MNEGYRKPSNFVCTDTLNLKKYFDDYAYECSNFNTVIFDETQTDLFLLSNKVSPGDRSTLEDVCSLDKLTVEGEIKPEEFDINFNFSKTPDGVERSTLNVLHLHRCPVRWVNSYIYKYKKTLLPTYVKPEPLEVENAMIDDLKDYIVTVQVFDPFTVPKQYFEKRTPLLSKIKCGYEIIIHSSQVLTKLKDILLCSSDIGSSKEINDINQYMRNKNKKEFYPSSYIFIENCFYNDMRDPAATDNSVVIRNWAKTRNIGVYKTGLMEKTKIQDIQFRLHYPYLYQHQGDCEHLIVFSDARLVNKYDKISISDYPYFKCENNFNTSTCFICQASTAHYLIENSVRLPYRFTYMCESCLLSYNFSDAKNKVRIGDFKLYPYFDKAGVNSSNN